MATNDDELSLRRLLFAADRIRGKLESSFMANLILTQPYVRLSSRVKSLPRAFNKLVRVRLERPDACASDIQDLLGFRFVTLFNSSMVEILSSVLDLVKADSDSSPFCDCCEINLFSSRPDSDPLSLRHTIDGFIASRAPTSVNYAVHSLDTLYSSIHVVTKYKVEIDEIDGSKSTYAFPIEIQLRTAMEDIWGQISHVTRYSHQESLQSAPVGSHLNALKQLLDGCALYAGLIKIDADVALTTAKENNEAPVSANGANSTPLRNVPPELADAFKAAIDKQTTATKIEESIDRPDLSTLVFQEAAQAFAALEAKAVAFGGLDEATRADVLYRTQMERAFCLLYTNTIAGMDEAYSIYSLIAKSSDTDAICRLRLGQTLRRKGNFAGARLMLHEAAALLETGADPRVKDTNRILGSIYMELGNVAYRLSQATVGEERLDNIRQAAEAAKRSFDYVDPADKTDRLGAINNLLYFTWEQIQASGKSAIDSDGLKRLLGHIDLGDVATYLPAHKHDAVYDTVCRLGGYIDDHIVELQAAQKVIEAIIEKVRRRTKSQAKAFDWSILQTALSADELDSYQYAVVVVSRSAMAAIQN